MGKRIAAIAVSVIVAALLLNYSSVTALPQAPAPTIDHPSPITYLVGTTGHSITWHPSSVIPANYTIYVTEKVGPPVMPMPTAFPVVEFAKWTGGSITQNVDGWREGTFYYTCTVYDIQGGSASSRVTVTIVSEISEISESAPQVELVAVGIGAIVAICIVVAAIVADRRTKPKLPV